MTDETTTDETVTYHATEIRVNKLLALPHQLRQRLAFLEKDGCTVSYDLVAETALTETFRDVSITGPRKVAEPAWQKINKDLGMRVTAAN